jgi:hypothetical protein
MTAARRVAIGQPQAGLLLSDPSSRGLLRASGAGKKHVAACAAADHKSGLDRPQRLTGYESRPGRSVGRLAVVTAELFFHSSLWRRHSSSFGVAIPRLCAGGHAGKEKIGAAPAAVLALNGAQQLDRLVVGESADDREIDARPDKITGPGDFGEKQNSAQSRSVSGSQRFTAFSRRSVSWSNSSHPREKLFSPADSTCPSAIARCHESTLTPGRALHLRLWDQTQRGTQPMSLPTSCGKSCSCLRPAA